MRRRRNRKAKHSNDRYGAVTVVLLILLVAAFIYAFQSLGIYDILFRPVFNNSTASPSVAPTSTVSPSGTISSASPAVTGTTAPGDKLSEEIKMNSVTLYGVQLGVFSKLENAQASSDSFRKSGSAGYILKEDTLYRVVDSVYYSENDAKAVRDVFRNGASPDACVIRVQASGINWKVTATRAQIDAIKGAVAALQSQIVALINAQKAAQQNQGTPADYKAAVLSAAQKFEDASNTMMKAVGTTNSAIIVKLNECLTESADSLNKLAQTDTADGTALATGLKYNIIDLLLKLQNKIMG